MGRRPRIDRGGFGVLAYVYAFVTFVGLLLTTGTGYLLVRGPFLGGALLEPTPLLGALAGFVVGVVVFGWGATRAADVTRF
ncbi:hypothetical protein NDI76_08225 [Halogeometricum sp. S1BR25-6]|uniref:DUF8132 domain-containing protein n=1 Tax=Halogeometricum salsisoli TaxID=2950536 RepID=A0ABU2GD52_9EURY|nr:hypothetical protein [Halogeometricum sp. S1BR25-6]MDS0298727.1 hypothetical protein [Halogeometricum sp. S1BR25-6]